MASLRLLLLFGLAALASLAFSNAENTTGTERATTASARACPAAFYAVGDRCILVNPFIEGGWDEAKYYCRTVDASFLEIETMQFFIDIINFLRQEGLDQHSYWLGARDVVTEGEFRWEVGGGLVPSGAPFWALKHDVGYDYFIEPLGGNYSNCLRMDDTRYLYLDDSDCTTDNAIICQTTSL